MPSSSMPQPLAGRVTGPGKSGSERLDPGAVRKAPDDRRRFPVDVQKVGSGEPVENVLVGWQVGQQPLDRKLSLCGSALSGGSRRASAKSSVVAISIIIARRPVSACPHHTGGRVDIAGIGHRG